ncbi:hypothetical protein [Streptomyces luteireticuli]|uniref:hypothetical protein n=1 Tax=Streptomyces luteireticuli TaxID=173858 RepID=UPI003555F902
MSDELPDAALPSVIEALCAVSHSWYGTDSQGEEWRKRALREAVPALLSRTTDPELRGRLLEQTDGQQVADLVETGVVTAGDLPAILRTHRVSRELVVGLARHTGQVDAAISLLPLLNDTDIEYIVTGWDLYQYRSEKSSVPPMPRALFDAVLERSLTPLASALLTPEECDDWTRPFGWSSRLGDGLDWRILATCPERWHELIGHPTLGPAVRHLLLDQAELEAHRRHLQASTSVFPDDETGERGIPAEPPPALDEDLLRACLPALCLPELTELPKPSVTGRHRLHHIAERVRRNPRLADMAAEELHAVADACVRRGRLLASPRKSTPDHQTLSLVEDLALLSNNSGHLAKACALLAVLEQPKVVSVPPDPRWAHINDDADLDSPARLLQRNHQHHRAEALVALAGNPRTPRTAVTELLPTLHPLELAWISHQDGAPDWLRTTAADLTPAEEGDGVLRLLTDDELDRLADPAAVLQSWLDAPETEGVLSRNDVYHAVLRSRHRTMDHLRQMPADRVLTWDEPNLPMPILIARCGGAPERWDALLQALDFSHDDEMISFGQLLDALGTQQAAATEPT